MHGTVEHELTAGAHELIGQELRERIVAGAKAEQTVAVDEILRALLLNEPGDADPMAVGGVEPFHELRRGFSDRIVELPQSQVLGEAHVTSGRLLRQPRDHILKDPSRGAGLMRGMSQAAPVHREGPIRRARRPRAPAWCAMSQLLLGSP